MKFDLVTSCRPDNTDNIDVNKNYENIDINENIDKRQLLRMNLRDGHNEVNNDWLLGLLRGQI